MRNDFIERCARALHAGAHPKVREVAPEALQPVPWERLMEPWRCFYRAQARACLIAASDQDLKDELRSRMFDRQYTVDDNGCWLWMGAVERRDGYWHFYDGTGKTKSAYRYAYEREHGPVPTGMVLDHICRVRRCVNPAHLRVVTNAENVISGIGIEAKIARGESCSNGHRWSVENTYVSPRGHRGCRTCLNASNKRYKAAKRALKQAAIDRAIQD